MKKYRNLNGASGVDAYETGTTFIRVRFVGSPRLYRYSYKKAGKIHVEQMKILAQKGRGLSTYISRFVKDLYD